jgi:protein-L-isoaspartate(D-aspartate) O-methyltransferase
MDLIDSLIQEGWLKTERIIEAFRKIRRVDFLPENIKDLAELNEALPIGFGQTISQPLVVAFMLELLEPKPGEKILDIGSGSGWTSALLAEIGGERGRVIAIEVIRELKDFGEENTKKYDFIRQGRVKFIYGDGSKGYQREAPFDKILASASAEKIPKAWREQIKIGGRIVTPIGSSIWLFIRKSEQEFEEIEYPGFVFVPLVIQEK